MDEILDRAQRKHGQSYCRPCAELGRIREGSERYSFGVYAMRACEECWRVSGYRDEPASAFDPLDAGEEW